MIHTSKTRAPLGLPAAMILAATVGAAGLAAAAPVGLPNPAAAFCVEKGGTYQIEDRRTGEKSVCRLPDGRVVDAWEFYRQQQGARNPYSAR